MSYLTESVFYQKLRNLLLVALRPQLGLLVLLTLFLLFYVHVPVSELALSQTFNGSVIFLLTVSSSIVLALAYFIRRTFITISTSLLVATLILFVSVLSTYLATDAAVNSLFGHAIEPNTYAALISATIVFVLSALVAYKKTTLSSFLLFILFCFGFYVTTITFVVPYLDLANFASQSVVATVASILALLSMYFIERTDVNRFIKLFACFMLVSGLYALLIAPISYTLITIVCIAFFSYFKIAFPPLFVTTHRLPFLTLVTGGLLLCTVIFPIKTLIPEANHFIVQPLPTLTESVAVTAGIYQDGTIAALFGSGVNSFKYAWIKYHPLAVNDTIFWNHEFPSARSFASNLMTEQGLFGFSTFLLFMSVLGISLLKSFRQKVELLYVSETSIVVTLFVWATLTLCFSDLSSQTFYLSIVFIGLTAGYSGQIKETRLYFKRSYLGLLVTVYAIAASLGLYLAYTNMVSVLWYERSVIAAINETNLELAKANVEKAIAYNPKALYYRSMAQLLHREIDLLINKEGEVTDEDITQLRVLITLALQNAQTALETERSHYLNPYILAKVYTTQALLGAEDNYDVGNATYRSASTLAPRSPLVYFSHAEYAFLQGDLDNAKLYLQKAIFLKPNFKEAHQLLNFIWNQ